MLKAKFKEKEVWRNLSGYARLEKKEIKDLASGRESIRQFCCDSGSLFRDYFIPHEGNGHRPKILRPHSLITIAVALALLKTAVTGYMFFIYPNRARMSELITSRVLELTNTDRRENGLPALALDPVLSAAARQKAEDMIAQDYFAHYSPDGRKPWDFINRAEYPYLFVGENLAMNFSSANSAHNALMQSPSHKKNILNNRYADVGLAVVTGMIDGQETNVLVELFASRQSPTLAIAPDISPTAGTTAERTVPPAPAAPAPAPAPAPAAAPSVDAARETAVKPPVARVSPEADTGSLGEALKETAPAGKDNGRESARSLTVIEYPAFVMGTEAAQIMPGGRISPNEELEAGAGPEAAYFPAVDDGAVSLAARLAHLLEYVLLAATLLIIAALLVNIFIRIEIQHKSVIVHTILVIIFTAGLLAWRVHFLDPVAGFVAVL